MEAMSSSDANTTAGRCSFNFMLFFCRFQHKMSKSWVRKWLWHFYRSMVFGRGSSNKQHTTMALATQRPDLICCCFTDTQILSLHPKESILSCFSTEERPTERPI